MLLGERREVLAGFHVLENVGGLRPRLRLGRRIGALGHGDQDVARAHAFGLLELVGVLRVEVGHLLRLDRRLGRDLVLDQLLHADVLADVRAHLIERRLARGEHLLEGLFRRELSLDLLHPRVNLRVGGRDLPRPALLHEQPVRDDLIEHAAQDLIALLGRHRSAVARFERRDRAIEFRLADVLAVDARDHVRDLRGNRLGRRRAERGSGRRRRARLRCRRRIARRSADAAGVLEQALTSDEASSVRVRYQECSLISRISASERMLYSGFCTVLRTALLRAR